MTVWAPRFHELQEHGSSSQEDNVTVCPVNPPALTTGNVKSGAPPEWVNDPVDEYVICRLVEVDVG